VSWAAASGARALVFVDGIDERAGVWIDGDDGHHLARVRRLGVGERLVLADGTGRWVSGPVVEVAEGAMRVEADGEPATEPERTPRLTIAFAPAKRDHGTEVVHQLVELGVDRIVPLRTDRGVVRWDGERGDKQLARLRRVAREAAMQSLRARPAEVAAPTTPAELAGAAGETPAGLVLADPRGVEVSRTALPDTDEWVVLVGPEGGFSPAELVALEACPRVAIGPHVLRAVTAPAAVAAAIATVR
jgi:16S rRNA (uracil1498-N3)-methyltransferase